MRKTQSEAKTVAFVLPPQLIGKTDINHLLRELEMLEEALVGQPNNRTSPPKITGLLNQTAQLNGYKLLDQTHRLHIADQLTKIRDHAPTLYISFAAEPSPKVTEEIISWLRTNIHRYVLLQIGLQPSIAAGCVLRTPNKIFDMSLRASLQKQTAYLLQLIKGAALDTPAPAAAAPVGKP